MNLEKSTINNNESIITDTIINYINFYIDTVFECCKQPHKEYNTECDDISLYREIDRILQTGNSLKGIFADTLTNKLSIISEEINMDNSEIKHVLHNMIDKIDKEAFS